MNVLIALSSCERDERLGLNRPARETWLHEAVSLGLDYKFFHGRGASPQGDVIVVDAPDDYPGLTYKTQEKLKWAMTHGYESVFVGFNDTYARPERLLERIALGHDYYGNVYTHPEFGRYCQGGVGYLLNKRAVSAVNSDTDTPYNPSEDAWVGKALLRAGIEPVTTGDFVGTGQYWDHHEDPPLKTNKVVTCHLSYLTTNLRFRPDHMYDVHNRWLRSA